MTFRSTLGFPGLPSTQGFAGSIESPGFAPTPTTAETLRHMADVIIGNDVQEIVCRHILHKAAAELESAEKDAARWQHWKKWWMATTNEGFRLPDSVLDMLDDLEIDDAMDESIDAARKSAQGGAG